MPGLKPVGRDAEWSHARERLAAVAAGRGSILIISGQAGTGKTHFLQSLEAEAKAIGLLTAFAENYDHVRAPFGPFVDVLRELSGVSADLAPKAPGDRAVFDRLLGASSATGESSTWDQRRLFVIIRDALERVSQNKPLVIAIDDMQWADPETLAFLQFAGSRIGGSRIAFVLGLRETADRRTGDTDGIGPLRRLDSISELQINPLSDGAMRELIALSLGPRQKIKRHVVDKICRLADGNPFFLRELLRDVAVTGTERKLPASVKQIAQSRLAGFDEEQARIIETAAVIGRVFCLTDLVEATHTEFRAVTRALRKARDTGLIVELDRSGERYTFTHELLRTAIYTEILAADRTWLHRDIARRLEEKGAGVVDHATLAYHLHSGGDFARARRFAELAGDSARTIFAFASAREHYLDAIADDGLDEETRARLDEKLGDMFNALGDAENAVVHYTKAQSYHQKRADWHKSTRLLLTLAHSSYRCGDVKAAMDACQRIVATPEAPESLRFGAHSSLAQFYAYQPDIAAAHQQIELADKIVGERLPINQVALEWTRALLAAENNDAEKFRASADMAIDIARRHANPATNAYTLINYATILGDQFGQFAAALESLEAAISIADASALSLASAFARCKKADIAHFRGNLSEAYRTITEISALHVDAFLARVDLSATAQFLLADLDMLDELPRFQDDKLLEAAFTSGEEARYADLAAAYVHAAGMRGDREACCALIERALEKIRSGTSVRDALYTFARFGTLAQVQATRQFVTASDQPRLLLPHLMIEGIWHRQRHNASEAKMHFAKAERLADRLGAKFYQAAALEELGREKDALSIYSAIGAFGHIRRLKPRRDGPLSRREGEVANLLREGKSNRAIAEILSLSERTVENHVASIFGKLGISTRGEFIAGHPSHRNKTTV